MFKHSSSTEKKRIKGEEAAQEGVEELFTAIN
jgi:hypothetical protein